MFQDFCYVAASKVHVFTREWSFLNAQLLGERSFGVKKVVRV